MIRYILIKETTCPGCGGDGWPLNDKSELCPMCGGEGQQRVGVAVVPEPVAEILVSQFGQAIPFDGRPMPGREVTPKDYVGL